MKFRSFAPAFIIASGFAFIPQSVNSQQASPPSITYKFAKGAELMQGRTEVTLSCGPENFVPWQTPNGTALRPTCDAMEKLDGQEFCNETDNMPTDKVQQDGALSRAWLAGARHMARQHYTCVADATSVDYRTFKAENLIVMLKSKGLQEQALPAVMRSPAAQDFVNRDVMGAIDYITPVELQAIRAKAENYVVDIYKTPRQDWQTKGACPIVDVIRACKVELAR
jgi:hypothetical protein